MSLRGNCNEEIGSQELPLASSTSSNSYFVINRLRSGRCLVQFPQLSPGMDQTASGSMLNKLQLVTDIVRYQVSVIVGEELACIVSSGAYFP